MNQRPLLSSLVAFTLLGSAAAQQNEEQEFNLRQAKALNTFAKKAFDKGFPRIAKVVWMQVHKLYDQATLPRFAVIKVMNNRMQARVRAQTQYREVG